MTTNAVRATLERLREFDTALLANTIGYIDPTPAHEYYMGGGIQSVTPALGPSVGIAVTCELDSSSPANKPNLDGYWQQLEEMSEVNVPTVWVVKCIGSRPHHECVIGDGMAKMLYSVGCVGVVTDGGARDVNGLLTVPMAVYCKSTTIHHTALRFRRMNQPVNIGGIKVCPGEVIHANAEGVITIPDACLDTLPDRAIQMRAFEHEAHEVFRRTDLSVAVKREKVGQIIVKYGFGDCGLHRNRK